MEAPSLPPSSNRLGAVVRIEGELRFLPAELVRRFVSAPPLSDIAGTRLAMGLVDGQVLAVISVGPRGSALTVCEVGGELVGLLGAEPEAAGIFVGDGGGVRYRGEVAEVLDIEQLVRAFARGPAELEVGA